MTAEGNRRWLWIGGILMVLAYLPSLTFYFLNLWNREHYQFFPLAIAGAIYLARQRLADVNRLDSSRWPALVILALGFALLVVATIFWSPWMGYVSSLLSLVGIIIGFGGMRLLRALVPALVMLALLIRPPLNLDTELALWLRQVAVKLSTYLLDVARVPHFVNGVVIEIPWDRLLVAEACSGINSTFFVAAFAVFTGLQKRRHWLHILLLVLAGFSFVILGNVFRIVLGATLRFRYGIDLLTGWPHETFGLVLFVAYVGLIASADFMLARWITRNPAAAFSVGVSLAGVSQRFFTFLGRSPFLSSRLVLMVPLAFFAAGTVQSARAWRQHHKTAILTQSHLKSDAWFALPDELAGWKNLSGHTPMGMQDYLEIGAIHSQAWTFRKDRIQAIIALSYPYHGFHDLTDCYTGHGWLLNSPNLKSDGGAQEKTIIEIEMTRQPFASGYLLYGAFNEDGQWQPPGLLEKRWNIRPEVVIENKTTYQVQLFSMAYAPLSPEEKLAAMDLYVAAQKQLKEQVLKQLMMK